MKPVSMKISEIEREVSNQVYDQINREIRQIIDDLHLQVLRVTYSQIYCTIALALERKLNEASH